MFSTSFVTLPWYFSAHQASNRDLKVLDGHGLVAPTASALFFMATKISAGGQILVEWKRGRTFVRPHNLNHPNKPKPKTIKVLFELPSGLGQCTGCLLSRWLGGCSWFSSTLLCLNKTWMKARSVLPQPLYSVEDWILIISSGVNRLPDDANRVSSWNKDLAIE